MTPFCLQPAGVILPNSIVVGKKSFPDVCKFIVSWYFSIKLGDNLLFPSHLLVRALRVWLGLASPTVFNERVSFPCAKSLAFIKTLFVLLEFLFRK